MQKWEKLNWRQKVNVIRELIPQSLKMPLHEKKDEPLSIVHYSEYVLMQLDLLDILERLWDGAGNYRDLSLSLIMPVFVGPHIYACACKSSHLWIHVHVFVHVGDSGKWRWLC